MQLLTPRLDLSESEILHQVTVRLIVPNEIRRWNDLIEEHHYLHSSQMVGEQLRYVVELEGQWVALMGWSAASYHLAAREAWVGWTSEQRRSRLMLMACNSRFLILPECHWPNLGTRAMRLCLESLSMDWEERYGHPIVAVESFVDPERFRGTIYRAANWEALGKTAGYSRASGDFYQVHERPKQLWVRELTPGARSWLRAKELPDFLAGYEREFIEKTKCTIGIQSLGSLWGLLHRELKDERSRMGRRYPQASVLCITFTALMCGVTGGYEAVACFGETLSQPQLRRLRCPKDKKTGRYKSPCANTFLYVLRGIDYTRLVKLMRLWQEHRQGQESGEAIAIDGKCMKGADHLDLVSAVEHSTCRTLEVEAVASKSNEIPAVQTLLSRLMLDGKIITVDALNTQRETARKTVVDCGGDYVMTVKQNQAGLFERIEKTMENSSSSVIEQSEKSHGRIQLRSIQTQIVEAEQIDFPFAAQVAKITRQVTSTQRVKVKNGYSKKKTMTKNTTEIVYIITSLTPIKADARKLAALVRNHWSIENGVHYRLDRTGDEDRCQIRTPALAILFSCLRRFVISEFTHWAKDKKPRRRTLPCFHKVMAARRGHVINSITEKPL